MDLDNTNTEEPDVIVDPEEGEEVESAPGASEFVDPENPDPEAQAGAEGEPEGEPEGDPEADPEPQEDTFSGIDPASLPAEMQNLYKGMQADYTKKMQGVRELRDKAGIVDRFNSDPQYAQQVIQQTLQRNGLQAVPVNANGQPVTDPNNAGGTAKASAPPEYVEMAKQHLDPSMHWMAQSMADMSYQMVQSAVAPLEQQRQADSQAQQQQIVTNWQNAYNASQDELSTRHPGWEKHTADMEALSQFLMSHELEHPKFGSKLEFLLKAVTGEAAATKKVIQRVRSAGKRKVGSQRGAGQTTTNIAEQVLKAPSSSSAFATAANAAIATHS